MLTAPKIIEKLKTNLFFKKAPESVGSLKNIKGSMIEVPEGEIIFQSGDDPEKVYLIVYGLVKIKIKTKTGAKIISKAAGDFFGVREVLENTERNSTAISEINTELYLIGRGEFFRLVYGNDEIKINIKINLAKIYDLTKEGAEAILESCNPANKPLTLFSNEPSHEGSGLFSEEETFEEFKEEIHEPEEIEEEEIHEPEEIEEEEISDDPGFDEKLLVIQDEPEINLEQSEISSIGENFEEEALVPSFEAEEEKFIEPEIVIEEEAEYKTSEVMLELESANKTIKLISKICLSDSAEEIYQSIKNDMIHIAGADEFVMFVFDGGYLTSVEANKEESSNFAIREKIAYELITMTEPVTLFDLDSTGIMDGIEQADETKIPVSLLYYPLTDKSKRIVGCFLFFSSINGRFNSSDVMAVEEIAISTSAILEKIISGKTSSSYKYEDLEKYTAFFGSEIKMAAETILSVSETLDRGKLTDKVRFGFDVIRERASGLKGFLDSIHFFLGIVSGFSKQPYLVSELLDDFLIKVSESAKKRDVTLLRKYEADIVMFFNRELFIHALTLITQNSFDAMPNGGKIYFSTSANESNILISIRDTGIGIHPDIRDKIFDPFCSYGKTGVGLGLPISNKIIKEHGGFIYLESSKTQGTEIIIALPV
jgi:hypothetical protein